MSILTEGGVISPETINFEDLLQAFRNDSEGLKEFHCYISALIDEFGVAVVVKLDISELKLSNTRSPSPLKVLARHSVRKRLLAIQEEKSTSQNAADSTEENVNTLIDLIGDDAIPAHLKDYLKLHGFHAKIAKMLHYQNVD